MTVLRYDTGTLSDVRRTPQGGIRVTATLTRPGVFEYRNPDGSIRREYRPKAEVAREDSIASLADAPVTDRHQGMVSAADWAGKAKGHVSGPARLDGDRVVAELVIQDVNLIAKIESGEAREVSCGYRCKTAPGPGLTESGERYDLTQTEIVYNHVAIVPRGRAGRDVALRLDEADNEIREDATPMKIEIIDGTEYEVGTPAHAKAARERDAKAAQTAGRLDALEAENKDLRARAAPANIAEAVRARATLEGHAAKAGIETRADMADADIRRAIVAKVLPGVDLKDKPEDYVTGVFEVALLQIGKAAESAAETRVDALAAVAGTKTQTREDAADTRPPDVIARERSIARVHAKARGEK